MSSYQPQPGDLVHVGCLSTTEHRVMAVCEGRAWIRCISTAEDRIKPVASLRQVEVEPEADPTESDAPLGHFLDPFFASVPKVA